jgi:heat-inducible transcriptional repressor
MALEERKKLILKAVIDSYIETAEPIGSKTLAIQNNFNISSATIRNEMSELEERGYLIHPHTSAGRIPTDKGYREYVDNLVMIPQMSPKEHKKVYDYFKDGFDEIAVLLQQASSALSQNTGYTSLTLTPRLRQSQLKQIKMLMIEPGRVLMVVVLEEGVVKDRLVRISDLLDNNQLTQIADAIEAGLSGLSLDEITFIAVAAAGKKTSVPENILNQILYEAYVSIKQADNVGIYMEGSNNMLNYPEFNDIGKARNFMNALAERGVVAGYLDEVNQGISGSGSTIDDCKSKDGNNSNSTDNSYFNTNGDSRSDEDDDCDKLALQNRRPYMIRIGQEISLSGFHDCSFVTTTYKIGERLLGSIGVVGPKRMEYGKVISQIDFVRTVLNAEIRKIGQRHHEIKERSNEENKERK